LKKINYIFLLLILSLFGKTLALPGNHFSGIKAGKTIRFEKSLKHAEITHAKFSSKVAKQKRPKKPKGIQVIEPVVSTYVFNSFSHYSDFSAHEVKGNYSLLLHYSHGKRGPPSDLA